MCAMHAASPRVESRAVENALEALECQLAECGFNMCAYPESWEQSAFESSVRVAVRGWKAFGPDDAVWLCLRACKEARVELRRRRAAWQQMSAMVREIRANLAAVGMCDMRWDEDTHGVAEALGRVNQMKE